MKNLLLGLLVAVGMTGISQNRTSLPDERGLGASFGVLTSANGYGARYSYMITCREKRARLAAGFLVQSGRNNLSGFEILGDYALTGYTTPGWKDEEEYPSNLELAAFFNVAANHNAHLSSYVLRQETETSQLACHAGAYGFRSVEAYGGVTLKWRLNKYFKWRNSIGVGGYNTLNYPGAMFYDKSSAGLILRSEITFLAP